MAVCAWNPKTMNEGFDPEHQYTNAFDAGYVLNFLANFHVGLREKVVVRQSLAGQNHDSVHNIAALLTIL